MQIRTGVGRVRNESVFSDNFGRNIVGKFTKLSKIGFSRESFTAYFSQFSGTTVKIFL